MWEEGVYQPLPVLIMKMSILSWNVRGLSSRDRRLRVKQMCKNWKVDVLVLQETKMEVFELKDVKEVWGRRNWGFIHKPTINRGGGILVAWDKGVISIQQSKIDGFSISI